MFIDSDEEFMLAGVLIGEENTGDKIKGKVYGTVNKYNRILAYLIGYLCFLGELMWIVVMKLAGYLT